MSSQMEPSYSRFWLLHTLYRLSLPTRISQGSSLPPTIPRYFVNSGFDLVKRTRSNAANTTKRKFMYSYTNWKNWGDDTYWVGEGKAYDWTLFLKNLGNSEKFPFLSLRRWCYINDLIPSFIVNCIRIWNVWILHMTFSNRNLRISKIF